MSTFFRWVIKLRYPILGFYALLLAPAVYFAMKVDQDNAPERLMVQSDPAYQTHQAFQRVFGQEELAFLFVDTPQAFDAKFLQVVDQLEQDLGKIPGVAANSLLSTYKKRTGVSEDLTFTPEEIQELKTVALSAPLLAQGFTDKTGSFLRIQLSLHTKDAEDRHRALKDIDQRLAQLDYKTAHITNIRKVGQPYVNDYLDADTRAAGIKYFSLFGLFVIALNAFLYRSWRTLLAFVFSLGVSTALTVGFVGVIGGKFTIVSSLIPMTVLITTTSTLVYLHSRFVECPPGADVDEHQIFSLSNKFLACTASIVATAIGFAALAVSNIRPIRQMGLWVAVGLAFTWVVVFTLFPALQKILRTPTQQKRQLAGQWFVKLAHRLPTWSYRYRWLLVGAALLWCVLGVVALFGIPKLLKHMDLETNSVEYINHNKPLYKNTKQLEEGPQGGLFLTEVWLEREKTLDPVANAFDIFDPAFLVAFKEWENQLSADKRISGLVGLPELLELSYALTHKGQVPSFASRVHDSTEPLDENVEQLIGTVGGALAGTNRSLLKDERIATIQANFKHFVRINDHAHVRLLVRSKTMKYEKLLALHQTIETTYRALQDKYPTLFKAFHLRITGNALLQAQISHHLVPTLTESFALTVAIIFATFLVVFRSGAARIMALIPSLFAILAMFALMRVAGISLNIATILIASTVLGSSENDQIHFFYHYQEKKKAGGTTQQSLEHTLLVAGRAILFATLINAGGFLAFALADLPPIRQFGLLSAVAFFLAMLADFTALPAALWLVFRHKPDPAAVPALPPLQPNI